MQPVTFLVPEVAITVPPDDVRRIVRTLERLDRAGSGFDYAGIGRKIRDAANLGGGGRVEPEPGEDVALLRALEHLRRWPGFRGEIDRLREALLGWTGPEQYEYGLVLRQPDGTTKTAHFTSYAGPYSRGDRLPVGEGDECWDVVDVELGELREDGPLDRLICEPCPPE